MSSLILNTHMKEAISINEMAYALEKAYPHLTFFEINKLVQQNILNRSKAATHLVLIENSDTEESSALNSFL